MTNYAATKYSLTDSQINAVLAGMETHIETRDSTNNPIWLIDIIQNGESTLYTGVIMTKGA